jgi:hypothetical protein
VLDLAERADRRLDDGALLELRRREAWGRMGSAEARASQHANDNAPRLRAHATQPEAREGATLPQRARS